jgi:hypothetical protein
MGKNDSSVQPLGEEFAGWQTLAKYRTETDFSWKLNWSLL